MVSLFNRSGPSQRSFKASSIWPKPTGTSHHDQRGEDPYGGGKDAHDAQIGGKLPFMGSTQSGEAEGGSQCQTELEGHDDEEPRHRNPGDCSVTLS